MVAVGKEAIPELKKRPCQFIREDIDEKVKSYSSDNPDYICLRHLRAYKHGMEMEYLSYTTSIRVPLLPILLQVRFYVTFTQVHYPYLGTPPLPRHTTYPGVYYCDPSR
jgi:hypothetical protein